MEPLMHICCNEHFNTWREREVCGQITLLKLRGRVRAPRAHLATDACADLTDHGHACRSRHKLRPCLLTTTCTTPHTSPSLVVRNDQQPATSRVPQRGVPVCCVFVTVWLTQCPQR